MPSIAQLRVLTAVSAVVLALLSTTASPSLGVAATAADGTISHPNEEVTWSGGPFFTSNPIQCVDDSDPTCDHFFLSVETNGVQRVVVAISPDEGFEDDDYDLFVYDDQGNLVGSDTSPDGNEAVVFENGDSSFYEVRVQPWLVEPGSTYSGVAMRTRETPVDVETEDCLEAVPESVAVDTGETIELSAILLLDGTDRTVAEEIMARAADAYLAHNIELTVERMRKVDFSSTTSGDLIDETKAVFGGVRPEGVDVVGTFTSKEMQAATGGGGTVVGQADCIGGVRFDNRAFFVVSDIRDIEDPDSGSTGTLNELGFNPNVDATAEVMAHEIGHLMGAHHHYANCIEGNLSSGADNDLSPCSLMFNAVNFASIDFSLLSSTVVRGHAVDFADES